MFNNYLQVIATNMNGWPDTGKRAPLLHCLGTEGLFYTLPDQGESMEDAVNALKTYFTPHRNIVAEHHAFRKRAQASHESVLQYGAALRDLAATCQFASNLEEVQLVESIHNPRLRERRLLEPDLTLQRAITLATQIEAVGEQVKLIAGDHSVPVQAVDSTPTRRRRKPLPPSTKAQSTASSRPPAAPSHRASSQTCYRCGSD